MKQFEKLFDQISLIAILVIFFCSVCLTSIAIHILYYVLPICLIVKGLIFKNPFIDLILIRKDVVIEHKESADKISDTIKESYYPPKLLLLHVFLFMIMPIALSLGHGDYFIEHHSHWINSANSLTMFVAYLSSIYMINVSHSLFDLDHSSNKKSHQKTLFLAKHGLTADFFAKIAAPLLIFISFAIDFFYSVYKEIFDLHQNHRWEGSANNPNVWAIQASLILLLLIATRTNFKLQQIPELSLKFLNLLGKYALPKIHVLITVLALAAVFLTGSITNIIGLTLASIPLFITITPVIFFTFIGLILAFNFGIIFFATEISTSKADLVFPFNKFPNKILPRIRIWRHILELWQSKDFSWIYGLGYSDYIHWTKSILKKKYDHIHNAFFHYFSIYGLLGLYSLYSFLFFLKNGFKELLKSKIHMVIIFYVLSISLTDCSFFFYENQLLFWLILPLISLSQKK